MSILSRGRTLLLAAVAAAAPALTQAQAPKADPLQFGKPNDVTAAYCNFMPTNRAGGYPTVSVVLVKQGVVPTEKDGKDVLVPIQRGDVTFQFSDNKSFLSRNGLAFPFPPATMMDLGKHFDEINELERLAPTLTTRCAEAANIPAPR